jgi:hypothetical protein
MQNSLKFLSSSNCCWWFNYFVEGRLLSLLYSGSELKVSLNDVIDFFIKRSQWNARWTGFFAQSTIHAAPDHMKGPNQMEHGKVRRDFPFCYHIRTFKAALFAEAHWTNVSAARTFNAFFEFSSPIVESLQEVFLFPLHRAGILWFHLFTFEPFIRIGQSAIARLSQLFRASHPYDHYLFEWDLIPCGECPQGPLVAPSNQNAKACL